MSEPAVASRGVLPAKGQGLQWPYFGAAQRRLVFTGLAIWVGTALPWFVFRPLGVTRYASPLAASWVLWAGLMALAGALSRWRLLALLSAVAAGGMAFILGSWQMGTIVQRCGLDVHLECFPGPGVFVVTAAGAATLWQGFRLAR